MEMQILSFYLPSLRSTVVFFRYVVVDKGGLAQYLALFALCALCTLTGKGDSYIDFYFLHYVDCECQFHHRDLRSTTHQNVTDYTT